MCSMAAMISCSKSDDAIDDDKTPEPEPPVELLYNVRLIAPVTDVQLEMMDLEINYTIESNSSTFTPNRMKTLSLPKTENCFIEAGLTSAGKPIIYYVDLPGEYTQVELLNGTIEYVAKGKKDGIAKYVNSSFNIFGRARTFVKTVDEDWFFDMDNPLNFEAFGDINPPSEAEINELINVYNVFGMKTNFTLLPISR